MTYAQLFFNNEIAFRLQSETLNFQSVLLNGRSFTDFISKIYQQKQDRTRCICSLQTFTRWGFSWLVAVYSQPKPRIQLYFINIIQTTTDRAFYMRIVTNCCCVAVWCVCKRNSLFVVSSLRIIPLPTLTKRALCIREMVWLSLRYWARTSSNYIDTRWIV